MTLSVLEGIQILSPSGLTLDDEVRGSLFRAWRFFSMSFSSHWSDPVDELLDIFSKKNDRLIV